MSVKYIYSDKMKPYQFNANKMAINISKARKKKTNQKH